jgi:hypothetical protein
LRSQLYEVNRRVKELGRSSATAEVESLQARLTANQKIKNLDLTLLSRKSLANSSTTGSGSDDGRGSPLPL